MHHGKYLGSYLDGARCHTCKCSTGVRLADIIRALSYKSCTLEFVGEVLKHVSENVVRFLDRSINQTLVWKLSLNSCI